MTIALLVEKENELVLHSETRVVNHPVYGNCSMNKSGILNVDSPYDVKIGFQCTGDLETLDVVGREHVIDDDPGSAETLVRQITWSISYSIDELDIQGDYEVFLFSKVGDKKILYRISNGRVVKLEWPEDKSYYVMSSSEKILNKLKYYFGLATLSSLTNIDSHAKRQRCVNKLYEDGIQNAILLMNTYGPDDILLGSIYRSFISREYGEKYYKDPIAITAY